MAGGPQASTRSGGDCATAAAKGSVTRHRSPQLPSSVVSCTLDAEPFEILCAQQILPAAPSQEQAAPGKIGTLLRQPLRHEHKRRHPEAACHEINAPGCSRDLEAPAERPEQAHRLAGLQACDPAGRPADHLVEQFDADLLRSRPDQAVDGKRPPQQRIDTVRKPQHYELARPGLGESRLAGQADATVTGGERFIVQHGSKRLDHTWVLGV